VFFEIPGIYFKSSREIDWAGCRSLRENDLWVIDDKLPNYFVSLGHLLG